MINHMVELYLTIIINRVVNYRYIIHPKRFLLSPGKLSGWKWTIRGKAETLEIKFSPLTIFRFRRWQTKKHEKRKFPHYRGFSKLKKTFLWMKIFIFSTQHNFRFSNQKRIYKVVIFISKKNDTRSLTSK